MFSILVSIHISISVARTSFIQVSCLYDFTTVENVSVLDGQPFTERHFCISSKMEVNSFNLD